MAANRIKGITIEIDGNTTKLQNALKDVDSQIKKTQNYLKDIDRLLKLDPGNVQLLTQKEKYLNQEIKATQDRLTELKKISKDSLSPEEWDTLQREIAETEQKLDGLEKEYKDFGSVAKQQLLAASQKVGEMGKKLEDAGRKIQPLSTAASGVGAALLGLGYNAVTSADDLNTMAKRTGLTTDELQKFKYASDLVDVSLEDITGALTKAKRNMTGHEEDWAKLGISVTNADGSMRDATDVFYEALDALSQIDNETERDQMAMEIFGKSADNLAGIIDDGGEALRQYGQQAEDMGLILSGDTLDALNATNDTIDQMKANVTGAAAELGATVAATLAPLVEQAAGWLTDVTQKLKEMSPEQMQVVLQVTALVAAIGPLLTVGGKLLSGMSLIMAHPLIAGGVLLGGLLATAIIKTYESVERWDDTNRQASEGLNALNDRVKDSVSAMDNARAARDKNLSAITAEYNRTKTLKAELDKLVDENGEVKKGYESRARFIVGELSKALDVEIEYNDGIIKDYQNISKEIDEMVETRRRAAVMNAFEAEYETAVRGVAQAQQNLSDAMLHGQEVTAQYNAQRRKVHDLEMAINAVSKDGVDVQTALNNLGSVGRKIWAEYYEEGDTGYELTKKLQAAWDEEADTLDYLEDEYVVATQAVADADAAYQDYQHTIENYEGAMQASIEGDTQAVETCLNNLKTGYQGAANEYERNLQKMVSDATREYENLKKEHESGEQGVTQAQVNAAGARKLQAERDLADYRNLITNGFQQLPSQAAAAMNQNAYLVNNAGQNLSGQVVNGVASGLNQMNAYGTAYSGHFGSGIINNAQAGYNGARYLVGQADAAASDNSGAYNSGSNWGAGYYNGISSWAQHIRNKAWEIAAGAVQSANYAQISRSPSRAMMKTGQYFGQGYEIGIESEESAVEQAAAGLAETAMGATADATGNFGGVYTASGSGGRAANVDNRSVTYGATNIQIYAQPGMDVNQLADAVQSRLALLQRQREAAFA